MELDDLKYQLKERLTSENTDKAVNDLSLLLQQQTTSLTERLKKNLRFEIIVSILMIIGFFVISFTIPYRSIRIYFSVFGILLLGLIVVLYLLYRRTHRLSATALPVKANLVSIVKIMEEFIKRYFQLTMAMIPTCLVVAYVLMSAEKNRIPAVDHFSTVRMDAAWKIIAATTVYFVIMIIGTYYFTKWYLNKLYGKYVMQLKECIKELGEEV